MARMDEGTAIEVMKLAPQDSFRVLMKHFEVIESELQEEINDPMTPKDRREILVFLRSQIRKEVIDVVKTAQRLLEKKQELTGQAKGTR
jgi:hypothetical protein